MLALQMNVSGVRVTAVSDPELSISSATMLVPGSPRWQNLYQNPGLWKLLERLVPQSTTHCATVLPAAEEEVQCR